VRAIWKGSVSFGLIYIPVKLYTATEKKDVRFNMLHRACKTPIQYRRYCPQCREEVSLEDVVRGYEVDKGRYVIIEDEELEALEEGGRRSIALLDFVDLNEVDPIFYEKSYYLAPAEGGEKAYELLKQAMRESGKAAVGRVAIRTKESLALVRAKERVLVMHTMLFPDEVRKPALIPELQYDVKIHENESKMALRLVENLAARFDPDKYGDERRKAVLEIIRAKAAGEHAVVVAPQQAEKVIDLMDALKRSIEETKKGRKTPKRREAKA